MEYRFVFFFTTSNKAGKFHFGKTDPRNIPQNRPAKHTCNPDRFKLQVKQLEANAAVVNDVLGTEPATSSVAFISFDFFFFDH